MKPLSEYIDLESVRSAMNGFKGRQPFDYCVVSHFFRDDIAWALSGEFPPYDSEKWFVYRNAIENKKALNDWHAFPPLTYQVLKALNSIEFVACLESVVDMPLFADDGLHGGGWHIHGPGGNLNPHLDYSIHPKLGLQRKLNIIVYLSPDLDREEYGGHLGLYANNGAENQAGDLAVEIAPRFNQAVIFDTTQNSWHGMSRVLTQPDGIYRRSLAVYYLTSATEQTNRRSRALFSPRDNQKGDQSVLELIKNRASESNHASAYVVDGDS
jgi:hypothetical protein